MISKWRHWFDGQRGGVFFLLLGIGISGIFVALEWRFPAAAQLQAVTGRVDWIYDSRGAMYFAARTTPQQFVVHVKGDADGRLRAALRSATGLYPVTLRFDPAQINHPAFLPGDFHVVYGVSVGGKEVSSFDQVRTSYRRDNLVALVMGLVFMLLGAQRLYIDRNRLTAGRAGGGKRTSRRLP